MLSDVPFSISIIDSKTLKKDQDTWSLVQEDLKDFKKDQEFL